MRILIYGINYAPELAGIGKYTGEMAAWLAGRGHEISVITAMPYYPEWRVQEPYPGKGWQCEEREGVRVYRCPLYVPKEVTSLRRILHEFSFLASSLRWWLSFLFKKKFDLVISISPPFHLGFLALAYARLRGSQLVTHVQDLQVDAAKELGMIRNERLLALMFRAERLILRGSTAVSTISPGMRRKIVEKGIPADKVLMIPNWVDTEKIKPIPRAESLRTELGIGSEKKVVLYAGNTGEKQGLEMVVEVAAQLAHHRDLLFVFVGSGGGRERLEALVQERCLTNVRFFPLQPYEKLSALLAMADLHLVLQKKAASDLVMPSKLTGILAAGGCAIVTALPGTSLYQIIREHDMGLLVAPESAEALRHGIEQALATDLSAYRSNARTYAENQLGRTAILAKMEESLLRLTDRDVRNAHPMG
ncbi:WcaI family glycosyltransferase [Persicitalea jodogahamensis]|uniref:Colanic acid biosynthesis glycosyltransferase WcaI n=1 Tax=Persicitalea jodogahamensis TaxID=402147 RepID=A0A8J3D755_9BACT|nr:WcaI family glycosyltransferase [Persicitalea jodogahamensis]GHB63006.1 colanic acid biosynthesis glycosyltransferase WcaI [Persicitalea jodogahamensis]